MKGFIKLLKKVYSALKPGGEFIWSSPRNKVNFSKVFLASWKNILDLRNIDNMFYGPMILQQALKIQNKGRRGIYHFLGAEDLKKILSDIGFNDIKLTMSMANQVNIISCKKPQIDA